MPKAKTLRASVISVFHSEKLPQSYVDEVDKLLGKIMILKTHKPDRTDWHVSPLRFMQLLRSKDRNDEVLIDSDCQTDPTATTHTSTQTDVDRIDAQVQTSLIPSCAMMDSATQTDSDTDPIVTKPSNKRILPDWINATMNVETAEPKPKRRKPNSKMNEGFGLVFNEKAVMNISSVDIPDEVLLTFSLGHKFIPPTTIENQEQVVSDITKVYMYGNTSGNLPSAIYGRLLECIKKYRPATLSYKSKQILLLVDLAKDFMKQHPELHVDVSDKGGVIVIMKHSDYVAKMLEKLNDPLTYAPLTMSSMASYVKRNRTLLLKCEQERFISKNQIEATLGNETATAMMYGLIKIHKENHPVRMINSNINVVGNKLAALILPILNGLNGSDPYRVINSESLAHTLRKTNIRPTDRIFTLDIKDMFTNIPINLVKKAIAAKNVVRQTKMSSALLMEIVEFITITSTEFCFEDKRFKQIRGLAMGVAISPVLACLVTSYLIEECLENLHPLTLIKKYVDDIVIITDQENMDKLMKILESHPSGLKFEVTCEREDNSLDYLDMTITRNNDRLSLKWFSKPYGSHLLINWYSGHENHNIMQTATNYVRVMFALSDTTFHDEIEDLAKDFLRRNSFPIVVANQIIKKAKKNESHPKQTLKYIGTVADEQLIARLNHKVKEMCDAPVKFVRKCSSLALRNSIHTPRKQKQAFETRNNLVVQFDCEECDFFRIEPITNPIVLFKWLGLNDNKNPLHAIRAHINTSQHIGYKHTVLHDCESSEETLRLAEIELVKIDQPVPKRYRYSNQVDIRKFYGKEQ